MGFTTGLLGGVTLTTATLYLTLHLHRQNRLQQSILLRQQSMLLNNIIDPPSDDLSLRPAPREVVRGGLFEMAKDKWNASLEDNVRKLNTTDWGILREQVEDVLHASWRSLRRMGEEAKKD